jgi:hypothetical protein
MGTHSQWHRPFLTAAFLLCICVSEQAAATLEYALLLDIADKEQALEHMKTLVSYFRFFSFMAVYYMVTQTRMCAHTHRVTGRMLTSCCFFGRIRGFAG